MSLINKYKKLSDDEKGVIELLTTCEATSLAFLSIGAVTLIDNYAGIFACSAAFCLSAVVAVTSFNKSFRRFGFDKESTKNIEEVEMQK